MKKETIETILIIIAFIIMIIIIKLIPSPDSYCTTIGGKEIEEAVKSFFK